MAETHGAKVVLDGDAAGATRAAQTARDGMGRFTKSVQEATQATDKLNTATGRARDSQGRFIKGNQQVADSGDRAKKSTLSLSDAINQANDRMRKASDAIGKVSMLLGGAGLVGIAIEAARTIDQLSQRALALSDVKGNLKISIDKARASTKGLVDDFTLQKTAMAGLRYGVFQTSEEMAKHVQIATTLARTLGTDSNKAVEDFTLGIARQSKLILDNLGILVSVEDANKKYAASIGTTVAKLNDEQKALAFRTEAYAQAEKAIKGLKLTEDTWAQSVQQTKTTLTNLLDTILELPKNVVELKNEITNTIGVTEEANVVLDVMGRVVLAGVTLGASEAYQALKLYNEEARVVGDRSGSLGFSGFKDFEKKAAQKNIEAAAPGMAVQLGLLDSVAAGTRAQQEWLRKHKPKGGDKWAAERALFNQRLLESQLANPAFSTTREGQEFQFGENSMAAGQQRQMQGSLQRKGSDTRDTGDANQRELAAVLRLTEAERAREEQRIDFFGTQQVDFGAEFARLETEREAKLAFWDEEAANATTRLELLDIQEARKQEIHEAELARIDVERQAREQEQARLKQYIAVGATAAQQITAGVLSITDARRGARQAALAQGKTEAEAARAAKIATLEATAGQLQALRNLAIQKAIEQTAMGLGALATTWGVPNPAAILHFAAAGTWAAVGVGAGLGARALSGKASGMRADDARSEASKGETNKGGVSGGSANAGGRGERPGSDSAIPGSPGPRAPSVSGGTGFGPAQRTLVIQGDVHTYGTPKREWIRQLDEELSLQGHDRQRRSA